MSGASRPLTTTESPDQFNGNYDSRNRQNVRLQRSDMWNGLAPVAGQGCKTGHFLYFLLRLFSLLRCVRHRNVSRFIDMCRNDEGENKLFGGRRLHIMSGIYVSRSIEL